ncbi:MAG: PrsW family intramembrane metalloprotease [Candidatus Moraniibacteriota bacterium]|nr:MAG: PrsW family intramembrane metalloprotease [Candidatus Moranbacteria bacterium]
MLYFSPKFYFLALIYGIFSAIASFLFQSFLVTLFPSTAFIPFFLLFSFVFIEEGMKFLFLKKLLSSQQSIWNTVILGLFFALGFSLLEISLIFSSPEKNIFSIAVFFPSFIHIITSIFWSLGIQKSSTLYILIFGLLAIFIHGLYNSILLLFFS